MGQRSQIYIRYKNEEGTQLIARYFQWNYAERMISRTRYIIEALDDIKKYPWQLNDEWYTKRIARFCDVNFDMRDITLSQDILSEVHDYFLEEARKDGYNGCIFGQDNNDGQLFIDVVLGDVPDTATENEKRYPPVSVKYAFLNYYSHTEKPLDAAGYMEMDAGENWKTKNLVIGGCEQDEESREIVKYTMDNIEYINEHVTLMTTEELNDFINDDYSHLVEGAQANE